MGVTWRVVPESWGRYVSSVNVLDREDAVVITVDMRCKRVPVDLQVLDGVRVAAFFDPFADDVGIVWPVRVSGDGAVDRWDGPEYPRIEFNFGGRDMVPVGDVGEYRYVFSFSVVERGALVQASAARQEVE